MTPESSLHIPRAKYGVIAAAAALCAVGVGAAAAAGFGGGGDAVRITAIAVAVGAVLGLLPAVMNISAEFWGVAVMGAGVGRALATLGIAYAMGGDSLRPVMVGASAATVLLLVVETAASVRILSAIERAKDERKKTGAVAPMERA